MAAAETTVMVAHADQIVDGFRMILIDEVRSHIQPACREFDERI